MVLSELISGTTLSILSITIIDGKARITGLIEREEAKATSVEITLKNICAHIRSICTSVVLYVTASTEGAIEIHEVVTSGDNKSFAASGDSGSGTS